MKNLFTIGDVSKLSSIPIQTLRYYDQIGLLKPCHIDPHTNYRYYSVAQLSVLDIIKNSKLMGMTLSEIQKILQTTISIDDMLTMLDKQIDVYEKKINEFSQIRYSMYTLRENLLKTNAHPQNEVYITYNDERKFLSFDYSSYSIVDQEVNLRKMILHVENIQKEVYALYGMKVSFEEYQKNKTFVGLDMRYFVNNLDLDSIQTLPQGNYLTIVYNGDGYKTSAYFQLLLNYIEENSLSVSGDFIQTWLIPQWDPQNDECTLSKIEILIND